jgi:predicted RNA polymerase sigma factor
VHGPAAGLELLKRLDDDARLAEHHRLPAVRGHLLEKAGDVPRAIEQYRLAARRTSSTPERNYLLMKAARLKERSQS